MRLAVAVLGVIARAPERSARHLCALPSQTPSIFRRSATASWTRFSRRAECVHPRRPSRGTRLCRRRSGHTGAAMLELRGLVKRYGPITALDGMECTIAPGEIFGLVGANGAGKTTAMRMIIGLVVPDEGSMSWMEQPIDAVARKGFGYMPEERGLYPKMTAHEQLRYFGELRGLPRATADDAAGYWIE